MPLDHKLAYFGEFGGFYVSELLLPALEQLEKSFLDFQKDPQLQKELNTLLSQFAGRPTPLFFAKNISSIWGANIFCKREDLLHTGSHKINNTIGQALLARSMGKTRLIAETGAGQHGVATATVAALLGFSCCIYMGEHDMQRQEQNVFRMQLLGAEVIGVGGSSGTLRHAINEALRDWSSTMDVTHYLLGSAVGPYPFPKIVQYFHKIIGEETKKQMLDQIGTLPDAMFACVGGGSNAIGFFTDFLEDDVLLFGAEPGGKSFKEGEHAATLSRGTPGILHGCFTFLLQNKEGQVQDVHSISAGLDYPAVGPQHAYFKESQRVKYIPVSDTEVLDAFYELIKKEGIIPALESSHAIALAKKVSAELRTSSSNLNIVINLSGRGDKDIGIVQNFNKTT